MILNLENIYHDYICALEDKKETHNLLRISRAGQCFLKHYYSINKFDSECLEPRKMRVGRVGTLIHEDIANAVEYFKVKHQPKYKVYVESAIIMDNKKGHADIYVVIVFPKKLEVYEVKTMTAWGWKRKFHKKEEYNVFAELQIATHTRGLQAKHNIQNVEMNLVYYKKDDSTMKTISVDNSWLDKSDNYWDKVNRFLESFENDCHFFKSVIPFHSDNVPVEPWECKWCGYYKAYCESK